MNKRVCVWGETQSNGPGSRIETTKLGKTTKTVLAGSTCSHGALLEKLLQDTLALSVAAIKHTPQSSIKEKGFTWLIAGQQ